MTGARATKKVSLAVAIPELQDPELRELATRVAQSMQLAAEKAVAHHADPGKYPLPAAAEAPEHLFASRYRQMRPEKQQQAMAAVLASVRAPLSQRSRTFGDLAAVRLDSSEAVGDQVRSIPYSKIFRTPALLTTVKRRFIFPDPRPDGGEDGQPGNGGPQPSGGPKLQFRIRRVDWLIETNDAGKDNIALGATRLEVGTDAAGAILTGSVEKVEERFVGNFKTGQSQTFNPPRVLTSFRFSNGLRFPKAFLVTLLVAEKDSGGFAAFLEKLAKAIAKEAEEQLAKYAGASLGAAVGAAAGGVLAGFIGAFVGVIVGFAIGLVVDFLGGVFKDDVMPPVSLNLALPSIESRFEDGQTTSPETVTRFRALGGIYDVTYDWAIVN